MCPRLGRLVLGVLVGLLLTTGHGSQNRAAAQTNAINKPPTELLKKYLRLDFHGVRLEPISQEALKPYITWKEEPAWGQVVVVSSYDIPMEVGRWQVLDNLDVIIPVEFTVLGSVYLESATFLSEPRVEVVRFHLKGLNGLWRITEPILPPHVSRKRMINYVREAVLEEREAWRVDRLTQLRDALRKAQ